MMGSDDSRAARFCPVCAHMLARNFCQVCGTPRLLSHREAYPEQYEHPLVGKRVVVRAPNGERRELARGEVERIVPSRWGRLVVLKGEPLRSWQLSIVERE